MTVVHYQPKDSAEVLKKQFIRQEDFFKLIGRKSEENRKMYIEIKKEIQINCNCSSGFMFLTITNPVLQKIKIHNNIIATDKTDKSLHGFGLYSLNQVVKKYSGKCNLDCSDDIFCVKIELNL